MHSSNKFGTLLAVIFTSISFILCMFYIFAKDSAYMHLTSSWFASLFSLLGLIFTLSLFRANRPAPLMLAVICIVLSGLFAIAMGVYWVLICLVISLIGCILYRASLPNH
jgi:hypothetical protein